MKMSFQFQDSDDFFKLLKHIPSKHGCMISFDINKNFTPIQLFMKLVPPSYMYLAQ